MFLSCEDVAFSRRGTPVLDGVSLAFQRGEIVGLLGLNGAGKSTLLRVLMGLLTPERGVVRLEGERLCGVQASWVARRLAYVPQGYGGVFSYSVRRMVALGCVPHRGIAGRLTAEDRDRVEAAMERLGLQELAERPVTRLSGGERQRVALARALVQNVAGLLLDEPMTGLDYGHQVRLMALLGELGAEGRLVLMTSHRPEEVFAGATRALILDQGRIVADGVPGDVVTAGNMSRLYGVLLKQIDQAGQRFFHSA